MTVKPQVDESSLKAGRLVSLAAERTRLANHRTFLAYQRTALTLFVAGVTFIRFFDSLIVEIIGGVFVPVGIITIVVGIVRYRRTRDRIRQAIQRR